MSNNSNNSRGPKSLGTKVRWRPEEPAREPAYRHVQRIIHDHLANQDGCITFLLVELRALQKRVNQLEAWRARTATQNTLVDEPLSHMDQSAGLHTRQD